MKIANFLCLMMLCLFVASCNQKYAPSAQLDNTLNDTNNDYALSPPPIDNALNDANNDFAFNFLQQVNATEQKEDNYMVSPVSASLALSMTYNGANGQTKTEFENVLGYKNSTAKKINTLNRSIIDGLASRDSSTTFDIANSIWYKSGFEVKRNFLNDNRTYYNAEVQGLNFNDPSSVDIINDWVSDNTQEKIPTIIDDVSSDVVMVLINALYFKSTWQHEFDPKANVMQEFYDEKGVSLGKKEMMQQRTNLEYYTHKDIFTSVKLPYKDDKFTMTLFKPQSGKNTNDIIAAMNSKAWRKWKANYAAKEVTVTMPKFKFDYKKELKDDLITMGMPSAFTPKRADFSGINSDLPLLISKVLQKTFIDVNEEGSEAAAVTAIIMIQTTSAISIPVIYFTLDRPFVFMITDKATNSICFVGKVGDPDYEE